MYSHVIGLTTSQGTLRFLLLPWWGWTCWSLSPISSSLMSPLLIIFLYPLVTTVIAPCWAAWASAAFGPLSCCFLVGLMLVLGLRCGYIYCGRRFFFVLGILCWGVVVGSMGAVAVDAWISWRIFLWTLTPSAPFFPLPGWLSWHILLLLPYVSSHQLGFTRHAWLFHSLPSPWWVPLFWWDVAYNLWRCGPRIRPIFSYPVVDFLATSQSP